MRIGWSLIIGRLWPDTLGLPAVVAGVSWLPQMKGHHDVRTQKPHDQGHAARRAGRRDPYREYLKAVRQLTAYYMISPDRLSERKVEDYILYVRDELGVAKGTFAPIFFGLKFFYLNTLGYDWPLFTKKKSAGRAGTVARCPQ